MIRILDIDASEELLARRRLHLRRAEKIVAPILEAVRRRGDAALYRCARRWDGLGGRSLVVEPHEMEESFAELSREFREALAAACGNIRRFAEKQSPRERFFRAGPGIRLGQIVRPLSSVGAYVPAGRYPLPSTLLMTVVPAQVAGVPCVSAACPRPSREILGAAHFLGMHASPGRLFRMGGAHAIAAFAFGTATVPRVERIVGPGNIYTTAAKKLLAGEVGIDFVAGPSEIVIVADDGADARYLAADMLAQAEHDVHAAAILLTRSRRLARRVAVEIGRQLRALPTAPVARRALASNGALVVVRSWEEAVAFCNRYAPEHLSVPDASLLGGIVNAGSVFIGPYSPEAAGDYAAGPNHVLPTSGTARLRGGLSAADFVKVIAVQELTRAGLEHLAGAVTTLARAEGLEAHARSVEVRTRG